MRLLLSAISVLLSIDCAHAQALVDLHGLRGLPLAAMRAHGSALHDALMLLAGDRSLTLAVWFEDGLRTR